MGLYVVDLHDVDSTRVAEVGGKGAHLGALTRIAGIRVPNGFCVTTAAFRRIAADAPSIDDWLDRLSQLQCDERQPIGTLTAAIRDALEAVAVPADVSGAITDALARLGAHTAVAVRSSATAEDRPGASFAGQHDSYLDVVGPAAVLDHVRRCWASLFTERAVTYRMRNGLDHRQVHMAVVVQQMISPRAAGVLFTADPVTGNRRIASVEATVGVGDALVSGLVKPDVYKLRDGQLVERSVAADPPALTDVQAVMLVAIGRRIEAHFGRPQDIEWCLAGDGFQVVQSRPITTLFPVPVDDDGQNHVYISVGHQQMMTDAMKPLGLSVMQLTARPVMHEAGGRLFVDAAPLLASPARRAGLLELFGRSDPLIRDAVETVLARGDFIRSVPDEPAGAPPADGSPPAIATDPAIVGSLMARSRASIAALKGDIATRSGSALLELILADIEELRRILFDPESHQAIMAGMEATWWLSDHLDAWLGEKDAVDRLTRSVPNNITSAMGLALMDVADVIRPHPEVVAYLEHGTDDDFLDAMAALPGGDAASAAIRAFLDEYGMRCIGEIDITRPRWAERPTALVPAILGNVEHFEPGAGERRFEQGRRDACATEQEVRQRLRAQPDGERKAEETTRMIDRVRTFIGYREYPKYGMVSRYFVYKQALLAEAERLVRAGVLRDEEDIFYLTLPELHDVVRTHQVDEVLIGQRKEAFRSYQMLTPPRVLTSDGEELHGRYRRDDVPPGALIGLPVSAGTVEGRARVIVDMSEADLVPGDILVTAHTDPSWSPLFVAVAGLVTEVGGLMTHGAVIAREYGLPAVVGVQDATRLIHDGQRIRVHATDGYVEIVA